MDEKIITVDISKSKFLRANPQWKYNYGQKLKFEGVQLPSHYQVHFSNSVDGEAKTQIGDSTGVEIPPEYFIPGQSIFAWIYVTDEDSGVTLRQVEIPIHKKALVIDQEITPHEQTVIDETIATLNDTIEDIPNQIAASLTEARDSGIFNGKDGSTIWISEFAPVAPNYTFSISGLSGTPDSIIKQNDLILYDIGLYKIKSVNESTVLADFYVELKDLNALNKNGDEMFGNLNMGLHKIINVAAAQFDDDAVNFKQVKEIVGEGVNSFKGNFATKTTLLAVNWQTTNPSGANYVNNNDFAIVQADETNNNECWKYVYIKNTGWVEQYRINEAPLTSAQMEAINSGITAEKVLEFNQVEGNVGAIEELETIDKSSIVAAINELNNNSKEQGIVIAAKYTKPPDGIPDSDLETAYAKEADVIGAIESIPNEINAALEAAKESGEFDGADGSGVWYTTERISGGENPFVRRRNLIGREGATAQVHDLLFAPDVGDEGEPTTLYEITSVGTACALNRLCKMKGTDGEDGTSPGVTITEIEGGHRVTITDETHPQGQSFDVMDGTGGSETVDDDFSTTSENPVQNKVITNAVTTMRGQMIELGNALVTKYTKPSGGIPATDLSASVQMRLEPDVLLCMYGITQSGEIQDALDNGVLPVAFRNDNYYMYIGYSDSQGYVFSRSTLTDTSRISCKDNVWSSGILAIPQLSSATPAALGTASAGSANSSSRADHVHPMPSAADVGAIAAPANPSSAQDLVYLNGAWVAADKLYIVNCTPTALDYSGTMDKTAAQIYAAHQEGKTIMFRVYQDASSYVDAVATMVWTNGNYTYPSFNAFIIMGEPVNLLVFARTLATNDGTKATYSTSIYPISVYSCIPEPATPTTGDFLCWNGSSWAATSLSTWQGGNY